MGEWQFRQGNQRGCALYQEDANLVPTSGRAVTKGNRASAYTGVKTSFFPKPGVSAKAVQVQIQAKLTIQVTFP